MVEELDSDEDMDIRGPGLASSTWGNRTALRNLGGGGGEGEGEGEGASRLGSRRRHAYRGADSEDDSSADDHDFDEILDQAMQAREDELVASAVARVQRAKARGRETVNLTKDELEAFQRRRWKLDREVERRRRREPRVAVAMDRIDADLLPYHPSPSDLRTGHIRPCSSSRITRPRLGPMTSSVSSRRDSQAERQREGSPFSYTYVHHQQARHASDTVAARTRSDMQLPNLQPPNMQLPNMQLPNTDAWMANAYASASAPSIPGVAGPGQVDVFQYLTDGPRMRIPSHAGSTASLRHGSATSENMAYAYGAGPLPYRAASGGGRRISNDEISAPKHAADDSSEGSSDDAGQGTRIASYSSGLGSDRGRSKESAILVGESPEPEARPVPTSTSSSKASSAKRKPVGGGKRRKN